MIRELEDDIERVEAFDDNDKELGEALLALLD
jgi:hypothetical protein